MLLLFLSHNVFHFIFRQKAFPCFRMCPNLQVLDDKYQWLFRVFSVLLLTAAYTHSCHVTCSSGASLEKLQTPPPHRPIYLLVVQLYTLIWRKWTGVKHESESLCMQNEWSWSRSVNWRQMWWCNVGQTHKGRKHKSGGGAPRLAPLHHVTLFCESWPLCVVGQQQRQKTFGITSCTHVIRKVF